MREATKIEEAVSVPLATLKTFAPGADDRELHELNQRAADPKNRLPIDGMDSLLGED